MDISVIQRWITECSRTHGDHCQAKPWSRASPTSTSAITNCRDFRPLWLVDVQKSCIKPAQSDDRYVALSYVWGQQRKGFSNREGEPPFEALQSNIVALQQEGALITIGTTTAPLPQTILDAIGIPNLLGERYLWVDRLCIVQDDAATKHSQIHHMSSIYANAHFTLVAAVESAYDGTQ